LHRRRFYFSLCHPLYLVLHLLAVARQQGVTVDVFIYKRRRDMFCEGFAEAGYEFAIPQGAFYRLKYFKHAVG